MQGWAVTGRYGCIFMNFCFYLEKLASSPKYLYCCYDTMISMQVLRFCALTGLENEETELLGF